MIDNVGLYRPFGLPTVYRDWQAMFEGRFAGKGRTHANERTTACMSVSSPGTETVDEGGQLETIMTHGRLMECLKSGSPLPGNKASQAESVAGGSPETIQRPSKRTLGIKARTDHHGQGAIPHRI